MAQGGTSVGIVRGGIDTESTTTDQGDTTTKTVPGIAVVGEKMGRPDRLAMSATTGHLRDEEGDATGMVRQRGAHLHLRVHCRCHSASVRRLDGMSMRQDTNNIQHNRRNRQVCHLGLKLPIPFYLTLLKAFSLFPALTAPRSLPFLPTRGFRCQCPYRHLAWAWGITPTLLVNPVGYTLAA